MTAAVSTELTIDYGHVELVPVHFDDLDPMGMVHNAWYALLIERALATFWRRHGHTFRDGRPTTPGRIQRRQGVQHQLPRSDPRARRRLRSLLARTHGSILWGVQLPSSLLRRYDRLRRGSPGRDQARPKDAAPIAVDT